MCIFDELGVEILFDATVKIMHMCNPKQIYEISVVYLNKKNIIYNGV